MGGGDSEYDLVAEYDLGGFGTLYEGARVGEEVGFMGLNGRGSEFDRVVLWSADAAAAAAATE